MMRAYDESYLMSAQRVLGDTMDYALVTLGIETELFEQIFLMSDAAKQFAAGNPAYVAGRTGCELARDILDASGYPYTAREDAMYIDKSPEFWCGWVLAYYQWATGRTFDSILSAASLSDIIAMYPVYHEMDVSRFTEAMNRRFAKRRMETGLKKHRQIAGLAQAELAKLSGVSLRQIRLLEQRPKNINKVRAITLYKLSRTLQCKMEDLIEF